MPVPHDAKPRNRARHKDVTKRTRGLILSQRGQRRRVLRLVRMATARLDQIVAEVLTERGERWRDYEKATKAHKTLVQQLAVERLTERVGNLLPYMKEKYIPYAAT